MHFTYIPLLIAIHGFTGQVLAQIDLGTAASFGVIASTAITNTGATIVDGDLGLFPNTEDSITGFPPGLSRVVYAGNGVADQALQDAGTAYDTASSLAPTSQIAGADLGGQRLVPGVYTSASSVLVTGTLTLDGQNDPNALFVFQIGSTLTTASSSSIVLVNGAQACNIFFQVGSSATLGTSTRFNGNILALTSISLLDDVSVQGGLYALNGAVTLINDRITPQSTRVAVTTSITPVEPSLTPSDSVMNNSGIAQSTSQVGAPSTTPLGDTTITVPSVTTATPVQPPTSTLPDLPPVDVPSTPIIPQVPNSTPIIGVPGTPIIPGVPTVPNVPGIPGLSSFLSRSTAESSTTSDMTFVLSSLRILATTGSLSAPTRSSSTQKTFASSSSTRTSSTRSDSTLTTFFSSRVLSTTSTGRPRSSLSVKASNSSSLEISTWTSVKPYSVYTSREAMKYTRTTHSSQKTQPYSAYVVSGTTETSTTPGKTTLIHGTPCTTLSYYEPSCACTQTTIVPISYTPEPTFTPVDIIKVDGMPCTTRQFYEPSCDCIRTSNVPIKVVATTVSIHTVISDIPYITSKHFEPACNCVQTATMPVRIAGQGEIADSTVEAVCVQTDQARDILYTCIAACMQPKAYATSPPQ